MNSSLNDFIEEIHQVEKKLVGLLDTIADSMNCLQLTLQDQTEGDDQLQDEEQAKDMFDQKLTELGQDLIEIQNDFKTILEKIESLGLLQHKSSSSFPYAISSAKDEKELEVLTHSIDFIQSILQSH
ncbi:hypothetical protein BC833DRAFT_606527 [Globomyces pollinis-pini]|nr:hypothetical protein BC833DRAFT_606527 [Globomyces pollinis-pini]